jgi:hypothetical protein
MMMAITASFSPNAKLLSVLNDNVDDFITISCNAVGQILVNGGAIYVRGRQPTVANTAEIQVFSKGGGDKIVLDESNGVLPAIEVFDGDGDHFVKGGARNDQVVSEACSDRLMWNRGEGAAKTVSDVPRLFTVGAMILSIAMCELVFQAGWKQTSAEKCNNDRMSDCQAVTASLESTSASPVASGLSSIPFVNAKSWMSTQLEHTNGPALHAVRRVEPGCAQETKLCQSPMLTLVRSIGRVEQKRHGHKS